MLGKKPPVSGGFLNLVLNYFINTILSNNIFNRIFLYKTILIILIKLFDNIINPLIVKE